MSSENLVYEEPQPIGQEKVREIIATNDTEAIESALVSVAFHEEDFQFALDITFECATSDVDEIRGTAILCLGHLARIHQSIPEQPTVSIVQSGLTDKSEYVRGQSENAADDIKMFVPSVGEKIKQ